MRPPSTLAAPDIRRGPGAEPSPDRVQSAVAVADYAIDLHDCRDDAELESELESWSDRPSGWDAGPFQIPFEAFIPRGVDGLVAAEKNLSQSRMVSGATRLQPSTMHTGQAAGVIAALAIQQGVPPRGVRPIDVQVTLVERGVRIGVHAFPDVPRDGAQWRGVEIAAARGIFTGRTDGTFGPDDALDRAQAALVVARLFALDTSDPPVRPTFADVGTSHFAYGAIEALYAAGITSGCRASAREYCPGDPLSRAQAAAFLARGMGLGDPLTRGQAALLVKRVLAHPE